MSINSISGTSDLRTNQADRSENAAANNKPDISEPITKKNRDEYIPSEEDKAIGLYKPSEDENGDPYIDYDAPENKAEKCTANTDRVDREIKELKEKAEQLRQQIKCASEDKRKELEDQLRMVETELSQKNNDGYRRKNAVFT